MKYNVYLSVAALAALPTVVLATGKQPPVNVVYILADDLGYGDLGCYGQQIIPTPYLDRMAAEGIRFTQHYAGCTVSAPSRCALMTGLHTGHAQIRGNKEMGSEGQRPMQENTFTLAKLFKAHGYDTGLFGKWGLGYPGSVSTPNRMGFDEFYGYNCQRKAHTFYPEYLWHNENRVMFDGNENAGRKTYSADSIHHHALDFIRSRNGKPFFAMLTYTLPHAEINVPHDDTYRKWESKFNETPWSAEKSSYYRSEKPRASFAAMVERLDRFVGEVMDELKQQGLDKNTIVIFTSDNGPHREGGADPDFFHSSGPLRGVKRDMYEGGVRVPMIAWSPTIIRGGQTTDHISAFWDVMPTFAHLIGLKLPVASDGVSFLPTLTGKGRQKAHDYLYWEFHEQGGKVAVRMGNWKGVKLNYGASPDAPMLLFDLTTDLHEDTDVAALHPGVVAQLESIVRQARTESPTFNFGRRQ